LVAGCFSTLATQPFDLVKTRIQLDPAKYSSLTRAFRLILQEEGVMRFFLGAGVRLSRKTLSSAITWTIYEELTSLDNSQLHVHHSALGEGDDRRHK
jgi:solute carrier family 25 protein 38